MGILEVPNDIILYMLRIYFPPSSSQCRLDLASLRLTCRLFLSAVSTFLCLCSSGDLFDFYRLSESRMKRVLEGIFRSSITSRIYSPLPFRLEKIIIDRTVFTSWKSLRYLSDIPSLNSITLESVGGLTDNSFLFLRTLSNLTSLNIHYDVSSLTIKAFQLLFLPFKELRLQKLLDEEDVELISFAKYSPTTKLSSLSLISNSKWDGTLLNTLHDSGNHFTCLKIDEMFEFDKKSIIHYLTSFKNEFDNLRFLSFGNMGIIDDDLLSFIPHSIKRLELYWLSKVTSLHNLSHVSNLEELKLANLTNLNDPTLFLFLNLNSLELICLDLYNFNIVVLNRLTKLTQLELISIGDSILSDYVRCLPTSLKKLKSSESYFEDLCLGNTFFAPTQLQTLYIEKISNTPKLNDPLLQSPQSRRVKQTDIFPPSLTQLSINRLENQAYFSILMERIVKADVNLQILNITEIDNDVVLCSSLPKTLKTLNLGEYCRIELNLKQLPIMLESLSFKLGLGDQIQYLNTLKLTNLTRLKLSLPSQFKTPLEKINLSQLPSSIQILHLQFDFTSWNFSEPLKNVPSTLKYLEFSSISSLTIADLKNIPKNITVIIYLNKGSWKDTSPWNEVGNFISPNIIIKGMTPQSIK